MGSVGPGLAGVGGAPRPLHSREDVGDECETCRSIVLGIAFIGLSQRKTYIFYVYGVEEKHNHLFFGIWVGRFIGLSVDRGKRSLHVLSQKEGSLPRVRDYRWRALCTRRAVLTLSVTPTQPNIRA